MFHILLRTKSKANNFNSALKFKMSIELCIIWVEPRKIIFVTYVYNLDEYYYKYEYNKIFGRNYATLNEKHL